MVLKFLDSEFPPDVYSVYRRNEDINRMEKIKWKRVEDIVPVGTDIIEKASPNDIKQGCLGDCWLLASLAAIAPHGNFRFLSNIFKTKKINEKGIYHFNFFFNGLKQDVCVDSYLPFLSSGEVYSSRSKKGVYWPDLLVKATAKYFKGYYNLEVGDCEEALRFLTGCPTITIDEKMSDEEEYWAKLMDYGSNDGILVTCGFDSEGSDGAVLDAAYRHKLLPDHVYTVMFAKEFPKNGPRLIRLRNPWGSRSFRGLWSANSPNWTPELKKFFDFEDDEEAREKNGYFFMDFKEFRCFNVVSACFADKDWHVTRIPLNLEKSDLVRTNIVELSVKKEDRVHLGIHQKNEHLQGVKTHIDVGAFIVDPSAKKSVSMLEVMLKRVNENELYLSPGTYHIILYSSGVHFETGETQREVALTIHSEKEGVSMRRLPEKGNAEHAFYSAIKNLAGTPQEISENLVISTLNSRDLVAVGLHRRGEKTTTVRVDPSKSTNVIPTLNSIPSMEAQNVCFTQKGTIVYKFTRVGDQPYEFLFNCTEI